jgi:hypothetical protein
MPDRVARSLRVGDVAAFRAGMVLIAAAIIDDAFVNPEPGAEAGDHLASGLLPLGALVLAFALAPRLCTRVRGWLALALGSLAVVGGVADGVRPIVAGRMGGDDLTAALGAVAGVGLLMLGVLTLWRSRDTGGPRARRVLRRVATGVAAVAVGLLVVLPVGIAIVATHRARSTVAAAELGRPYRDVTLTAGDGLRLRAWYVPSRNGASVIAFPGRSQPVPHARMLVRHGYGVLLLDRRGEGESEGDYNAFGWTGERDLRAAIAFLQRQPDVRDGRIGGLGLSVGGELMLQTAAHTRALRAVVSEGAGQRSLAEHLDNPDLGGVQRWFSGMLAQTAAVAVLSNSSPPASLAELAREVAPRPVLLIAAKHGHEDEALNDVYAANGGGSSELWQVAHGGHTGALAAEPHEYERRVVGFLDSALLGAGRPQRSTTDPGTRSATRVAVASPDSASR